MDRPRAPSGTCWSALASRSVTRPAPRAAPLVVAGWLAAVSCALGVSEATTASAAEPEPVALEWKAPADCPRGSDVVAEVDRILENSSSVKPSQPIHATAQVSYDGARYQVRLQIETAQGSSTRDIHSSSCRAVADASALVLALVIDPNARPPEPAPAPAPEKAPAPKPVQRRPPGRARPLRPTLRPTPRPAPVSVHALAWVGADLGSLPALAPMFGAGAGVQVGAQRFELGAELWPERFGGVAGSATTGGEFSMLAGSLRTCRSLLSGKLELGPCGAVEVGRLHARGMGVDQPSQASKLWTALVLGGELRWVPVQVLAVTLRLGAAFPLLRPRFVLTGIGPVYRPAVVAGRAALGLDVRF